MNKDILDKLNINIHERVFNPRCIKLNLNENKLIENTKIFSGITTDVYTKMFFSSEYSIATFASIIITMLNRFMKNIRLEHNEHFIPLFKGGSVMAFYFIASKLTNYGDVNFVPQNIVAGFSSTKFDEIWKKKICGCFKFSDNDFAIDHKNMSPERFVHVYNDLILMVYECLKKFIYLHCDFKTYTIDDRTTKKIADMFNEKKTSLIYQLPTRTSDLQTFKVNKEGNIIQEENDKHLTQLQFYQGTYAKEMFVSEPRYDFFLTHDLTGRPCLYNIEITEPVKNSYVSYNATIPPRYSNVLANFVLMRIKHNVIIKTPSAPPIKAPTEFVDIAIPLPNDDYIKFVHTIDFNDAYKQFVTQKQGWNDINITVYSPFLLIFDLTHILFLKNPFPWLDEKYGKRIIRWLFFLTHIKIPDFDLFGALLQVLRYVYNNCRSNIQLHNQIEIDAMFGQFDEITGGINLTINREFPTLEIFCAKKNDSIANACLNPSENKMHDDVFTFDNPALDSSAISSFVKFVLLTHIMIQNDVNWELFVKKSFASYNFDEIPADQLTKMTKEFKNKFFEFIKKSLKYGLIFYIMTHKIQLQPTRYAPIRLKDIHFSSPSSSSSSSSAAGTSTLVVGGKNKYTVNKYKYENLTPPKYVSEKIILEKEPNSSHYFMTMNLSTMTSAYEKYYADRRVTRANIKIVEHGDINEIDI